MGCKCNEKNKAPKVETTRARVPSSKRTQEQTAQEAASGNKKLSNSSLLTKVLFGRK